MATWKQGLIVLAVILTIAVALKVMEFFQSDVVEKDATRFVIEDLRANHPDADIAIMNITPKYNQQEKRYFEVKARVTDDALSPCPKRSHIYYNYPLQNFVPQPPEIITSAGCRVCTTGTCTIAFPEEAIIASHTLNGTAEVQRYVDANPSAIPAASETVDSWMVKWDAAGASSYYMVKVRRDGNGLVVQNVPKG
jgi:hypothetical protein